MSRIYCPFWSWSWFSVWRSSTRTNKMGISPPGRPPSSFSFLHTQHQLFCGSFFVDMIVPQPPLRGFTKLISNNDLLLSFACILWEHSKKNLARQPSFGDEIPSGFSNNQTFKKSQESIRVENTSLIVYRIYPKMNSTTILSLFLSKEGDETPSKTKHHHSQAQTPKVSRRGWVYSIIRHIRGSA